MPKKATQPLSWRTPYPQTPFIPRRQTDETLERKAEEWGVAKADLRDLGPNMAKEKAEGKLSSEEESEYRSRLESFRSPLTDAALEELAEVLEVTASSKIACLAEAVERVLMRHFSSLNERPSMKQVEAELEAIETASMELNQLIGRALGGGIGSYSFHEMRSAYDCFKLGVLPVAGSISDLTGEFAGTQEQPQFREIIYSMMNNTVRLGRAAEKAREMLFPEQGWSKPGRPGIWPLKDTVRALCRIIDEYCPKEHSARNGVGEYDGDQYYRNSFNRVRLHFVKTALSSAEISFPSDLRIGKLMPPFRGKRNDVGHERGA